MSDDVEVESVVDTADSEASGTESRTIEIEGETHTVADFSDQDLFAFRAQEREARQKPQDDGSWAELREARQPRYEEPEEETPEETEDSPQQEREIKKPWGRIRRLEKERNEARKEAHKVSELEAKVDRLLAQLEKQGAPQELGEEEVPPDPQIAPVQAILHKLEETQRELKEIKEESARKEQLAEARAAMSESNIRINVEMENDPVFKGAFDHVTKVVLNNVKDDPRFGATEHERRVRAVEQLIRRQLDWHKNGLDPVQEIYKQAMKFGYDPEDMMTRLGGTYDENGAWVSSESPAPAPRRQPAAPKPKTAAEKIAASRARTAGTASIAAAVGKPPRHFNAKRLEGMDDRKAEYEIRKAIDNGELAPGKYNKYSPSLRDLLEGTSAVWDDGI